MLIAVAAASDSYNRPAYTAPVYNTHSYTAPAYTAPAYSAPTYNKEYEYVIKFNPLLYKFSIPFHTVPFKHESCEPNLLFI